jgi:ribosomal protein L37AE/L43A
LRNASLTLHPERSCPACGLTFVADRRLSSIWCSDACRQRGFRLRHQPPDQVQVLLLRRSPKTAVVYQCPECETRYLGSQRCPDCGVFCRRRPGPGGLCPHCDEPVALSDLVDVEATP